MKNLKSILLILILFGTLSAVNAQRRVVKVYPRIGTVVSTVHQPRLVVHRGVNFHVSNGVWYRFRGGRYVVSAAPVGIQVRHLPRGNKVVRINGRKLYRYRGVWYKKYGRGYMIVNV
ncbi:DUF6515 family protein [Ulvibacterium sp.]|uniref:DUF6515 family protein n=1 Tax=Ulvibacterium sp. TaxID=2665914 RepID=UPI0026278B6A|nr:DUF6515 family protein [Ulvibacterium sp.]